MSKELISAFEKPDNQAKDYSEADMNKRLEMYSEITHNKLLSYKTKTAFVLFSKQEAYEVLKEDLSKGLLQLREGTPNAICETAFKGLYETKVWYIPDRLKFWDRRFGELLKYPFLTYDDDENTWSEILRSYCAYSTPKKEEYANARVCNKDWEFWAEMLAVAKHNSHPLFEESFQILKERGLPDKVFKKKQEELETLYMPDNKGKCGIEHFGYIKAW